jgi:hypothetical protein
MEWIQPASVPAHPCGFSPFGVCAERKLQALKTAGLHAGLAGSVPLQPKDVMPHSTKRRIEKYTEYIAKTLDYA